MALPVELLHREPVATELLLAAGDSEAEKDMEELGLPLELLLRDRPEEALGSLALGVTLTDAEPVARLGEASALADADQQALADCTAVSEEELLGLLVTEALPDAEAEG